MECELGAVAPERPGDVPFLRDVAARIAAQRPVALLHAGLASVWGGMLLSDPAPFPMVMLTACAGLAGYMVLRAAWAGRFLRRTAWVGAA